MDHTERNEIAISEAGDNHQDDGPGIIDEQNREVGTWLLITDHRQWN